MIGINSTSYMRLALHEALKGRYLTYTNPMVGAVFVKNNNIIGVGHHLGFGYEHAEVNAFHNVQSPEEVNNSTLYVTLEPCSHFGKTPPCCRQLVAWGVKMVYIAQKDPNPLVGGKGISYLREHGVLVHIGLEQAAAEKLNQFYNFFYRQRRPFITLKVAQTLDGRVSLGGEQRTYLTDKVANQDVQKLRGDYQAILVGSGTVLADDPKLTVRQQLKYPPVRVVLDRRGRITPAQQVTDNAAPTWLFTENQKSAAKLANTTVKVFYKPKWSINLVIQELAQAGIQSVLVEGGPQLHDAFLVTNNWQRLIIYQTNQLAGGTGLAAFQSQRQSTELTTLEIRSVKKIGNAIKITGEMA
ncbi:bifunctional diaminohydroxyphosphoribosylaminopyrimidine deaminase/5-amino-6-(5-phosphoribosylamino)uracil reductase RibD [Loigolactobacillus iwatensis]|uniref:bifunctional diaminohydroxyphosphoribosylaminopyrimidine deaminase/5-amino-6-(5-phosphoribosylamino)uracil reductase RibD n=1 Tax=Loigolactobacillus iwatensis TaxID=1267156 RepID=UPI000F7E58CD|nr:bifunctional diaminohydroxyphosphoribosylaminopyrimidine deaminase/5-amino-6-(5-phosphoribosylamino)uracil reductase RibD [Loigolactobacillus iwatensis]